MINTPPFNQDLGVSVVIPTYNRGHLVTRAIDSAIKAIAKHDEIIVVDDGSNDGTESVLKVFGKRIRYIRTENRGAGPARNLGIELAKRKWIAFLDSDDEWMPDHLRLHRAFLAQSEVVFSFSNFNVHYDLQPHRGPSRMRLVSWMGEPRNLEEIIGSGEPYSKYAVLPEGRDEFTVHIGNLYHVMLHSNYVAAWASVVNRELAGEKLKFPEDLPTYEDYDFFVKLCRIGNVAYFNCATAINHAHSGPRLNAINSLERCVARMKILERNWGSDHAFLQIHRMDYEKKLREVKTSRVKELIRQGDTKTARIEVKELAQWSFSLWILANLPGKLASFIARQVSRLLKNLRRFVKR